MYRMTTDGFEITVETFYLDERSNPLEHHYVWAYRITIANHSALTARLISRHWHITDGSGKVEEVEGYGVVGEQPELSPGDSYQYTSGCPLETPSGIMVGHYTMIDADGRRFEIHIPAFSLDLPLDQRTIN